MRIEDYIGRLVEYGVYTGLVALEDKRYITNRLFEIMEVDGISEEQMEQKDQKECQNLEELLNALLNEAYQKKLFAENTITYRDLFDTKLMGALTPAPSQVIEKFWNLYQETPEKATDYFYKFCQDSDYIRRYRICKDRKWKTKTEYGELDITINLSKPEKDPKAIAAAKNAVLSEYPKCLLCMENEGYAGRINHPARQNHRIIPIEIGNEKWGFQYSPYVYYTEHCIVLNQCHKPMKIDTSTFRKLFDFIKQFPHYFIGSNADLPIVGGSILSHDHFQGGHYEFPMAKAPIEKLFTLKGFEELETGIVKWPMSVIRLRGKSAERLIEAGSYILKKWRGYTDEKAFLYAVTKETGEAHNTITPIARQKSGIFELDLVLRNNIVTEQYPFGVYHPHQELHHIKKENIGLIEVMGLAVLPSRLKLELEGIKSALLKQKEIREDKQLEKHTEWVEEIRQKYSVFQEDTIDAVLQEEVGKVFEQVLHHAGVYKRNKEGREAFLRFIDYLNTEAFPQV